MNSNKNILMPKQPKDIEPPTCHFMIMFYDCSDYEEWWECQHCGHTKLIHRENGER